jgi:predicted nuclease of predicted toxin-antitoxin system
MRLLLDENLSRRIVPFLQAQYPGSSQVALVGLEQKSDLEIWQYAKDHEFTIVTKDSDFQEISLLNGAPPKVIWLRVGNTSKASVIRILTERFEAIADAIIDAETHCLEVE